MDITVAPFLFDDYGTRDLTSLGLEPILFPGFEEETRKCLFYFLRGLMLLFIIVALPLQVLLVSSVVSNVIHIIVLTRKSMRNNSVNIILAVMAAHDIAQSLLFFLASAMKIKRLHNTGKLENDVKVSPTHLSLLLIGTSLKRTSANLPVLMATTRVLVIRNFDNVKFSFLTKTKFGILSTTTLIFISSLFEFIFFLILTSSGPFCCVMDVGILDKYEVVYLEYYPVPSKLIGIHDSIGVFTSAVFPCFFYPFLTFILIQELREAKKKTDSLRKNNGTNNVTKMITIMTVFFMISELPQAFGGGLTIFNGNSQGIFYIGFFLMDLFGVLTTIGANLQCLICYKMSSVYKEEFRRVFCTETPIETSVVSNITASRQLPDN